MFTIPVFAFLASLVWIPLVCLGGSFAVFRHIPARSRLLLGALATPFLFIPGCIGSCFLIEPLFLWEGSGEPPNVFLERPPAIAADVHYYKNTSHEMFCCKLSEEAFVRWCDERSMKLIYAGGPGEHPMARYPSCAAITGDARADLVYDCKTRSAKGGGYCATYCRSRGLMVYEANYW